MTAKESQETLTVEVKNVSKTVRMPVAIYKVLQRAHDSYGISATDIVVDALWLYLGRGDAEAGHLQALVRQTAGELEPGPGTPGRGVTKAVVGEKLSQFSAARQLRDRSPQGPGHTPHKGHTP